MASGENILREQIIEFKEKIATIKEEMAQLQKRRKAYVAKLKLMVRDSAIPPFASSIFEN